MKDKDCNSVITRKVVCFEKRDNTYLVYLVVFGYDVIPEENLQGCLFRDKLPLYIIPDFKFTEHIELFKKQMYRIEVKEK